MCVLSAIRRWHIVRSLSLTNTFIDNHKQQTIALQFSMMIYTQRKCIVARSICRRACIRQFFFSFFTLFRILFFVGHLVSFWLWSNLPIEYGALIITVMRLCLCSLCASMRRCECCWFNWFMLVAECWVVPSLLLEMSLLCLHTKYNGGFYSIESECFSVVEHYAIFLVRIYQPECSTVRIKSIQFEQSGKFHH